MSILLWAMQILLAAYFLLTGIVHFTLPAGLPGPMSWMLELPRWVHVLSGSAEVLAALGLVLPGITRIQPRLTPLAGVGLVIVMILAGAWHVGRGEFPNLLMNATLAILAGFVAYGRWRLRPLPQGSAP